MLRFRPGLIAFLLVLTTLCGFSATSFAQTAQISEGVPAESLLGEQFCFTTRLTNVGPPGYGPYFRIELPPEIALDSAQFFGSTTSVVVSPLGAFPAAPNNQLTDPRVNQPVTGTPGNSLTLVALPIGAVVEGGPDLDLEICATISPGAVLGTPLPVEITPVYQFGNTATGANGPIIGAPVSQDVIPVVVSLSKAENTPEGERPPGQIWPFEYSLAADIADGAIISPIQITDTLPAQFQFNGQLAFSGGGNCTATQLPSLSIPGGTLEIECTNVPPGQLGGDDIVVTYGGYITDVLSELSCATDTLTNLAIGSGTYQPQQGPDQVLNSNDVSTTLTAKHLAIQKTAAPGTVAPNTAVVFTLNAQLTEFDGLSQLVIVDTLPDGLDFVSHGSLVVNGAGIGIVPTVTANADSTTTISYDIAALTGALPAGTSITLSYNAQVAEIFSQTGLPVLAGDSLTSGTTSTYQLASASAPCTEGSSATVSVAPLAVSKELLNPQPLYRPGDEAVFRLTQTVPAGSTNNVVFEDFLPLPAFDVTALDLNTDISNAPGSVRRGPGDTAGLTPTQISIDVPQNAVTIAWPNVVNSSALVLQVDLTATVTGEPFADGLFLTNIFSTSNQTTNGQVITNIDSDDLNIAAPSLTITKGVAATSGQGSITPPPSTLPIDGNINGADGNDIISYRITVENIGNALAYEVLVTDPGVPSVFAQCTISSVTDSNSAALGFSGSLVTGITLDDPLGYNNPVAADAAFDSTAFVTVDCLVSPTVAPDTSFANTASVSWTALPGATRFPDVTDNATGTTRSTSIQKLFVATSEPATSDALNPPRATIGEVVRYRLVLELPEGQVSNLNFRERFPNTLQFLDDGTATVAFISNSGGVSSSTLAIPNINGDAADVASVPSNLITFPVPGSAIVGAPFNPGTDPRFNLGTVTNSDNDPDAEFVVLELNAVMSNVNGNNRDNAFAAFSGGSNLNGNSNAVRVRLAEPNLSIAKEATPSVGDAGDTIAFLITVGNGSGNNLSPAYDVTLTDVLPAGLSGATTPVIVPAGGTCTNLGAVDNSAGDSLAFFFNEIGPGCIVEISFEATLDPDVAPGTFIGNVASVDWTSLPGTNGTAVNPTGSLAPGAPGSNAGERDDSGGVNDYTGSDIAIVDIPGVGIAKRVSTTNQVASGTLQYRPLVTDLLIGEQATFEIVATLPEGITPSLIITDTLPFTNGVMRIDSAQVISVGGSLTPDNFAPTGVIEDLQLLDGINDTVSFDFGEVINTADMDSNSDDQVVIEVVATLVNVPANVNGDALNNSVLVQFGSGLDASATAPLDVIEPVLNVVKTGSISQGDAGDPVTYTVTISHANTSTAIAQDLVLEDILPAEVLLTQGSLVVTSGPNFATVSDTGNTVAAGWTELLLGEEIVLQYQAQLQQTVQPGQSITNTANVEWDSIPGPDPDERTNSAGNSHSIIITAPGIDKVVFTTSEAGTGSGQFGPPEDLTIGEVVSYLFTVELPEGTTNNAIVVDQLPTGSSVLQLLSAALVDVGSSLSGAGLPAPPLAGTVSDSNSDGVIDRAVWNLGTIINTPDGVANDEDLLTFEVIAVVLDVAANQSGDQEQLNIAGITSSTANSSGTAAVDIVAPNVVLRKSVLNPADGFVDAGDSVTMRLEIDHAGNSTADSYDNIVTDALPAGLSWVGDGTVVSNCPGLSTDSSQAPDIVFTFDELTLALDSCQIDYELVVDDDVQPTQQLQNSAMLEYASTPLFAAGRTRVGMSAAVASVVVIAPTLVKLAVDTSQPDTTLDQGDPTLLDLTIGETVTYELTIVLPEGVLPDAVLIDALPADANGVIELIGANVTSVGANISTTLPGTAVFSDQRLGDGLLDTATLDFGTITNAPDGQETAADRIVVEIVGRVADVPINQDGDVLTNQALFTSGVGTLEDTADVEVVAPELALDKGMTLQADGVVRIVLQLQNTGTAPAYDIEITDILDDADWLVSALATQSLSAGFDLDVQADTPAPGQQTVRFVTDPLSVSPAGTVPVGGVVSAVFEVPLAVLPPDPNPLPNEADLEAADTLPGNDASARDLAPLNAAASIAVPDLVLLKTAALQSDNDNSGSITAGDTLRYTLELANIGAATATSLVIDDAPDPNSALIVGSVITSSGSVSIGNTAGDTTVQVLPADLAVGATVTVTYDTLINNPLPAGVDSVINQAVVDSEELPPVPSDDPSDPTGDMDPTVVPIVAQPDLTLSKDDGGATATAGGLITWSLGYANVGTQDATGVVITDTVPDNTSFAAAASSIGWACVPNTAAGASCSLSIGDLAAGDSGSVNFAVRVDSALPAGVELVTNTAQIADDGSNGADPTPDNNIATDTTPLDAVPDLAITKDDGGATGVPGQLLAWALQVTNVGSQGASGVTVSDQVPANTVFDAAASTPGWSCAPNANPGSVCTINVGDVDVGDVVAVSFTVRIDDPVGAGVRAVSNTATVSDDGTNGADPNLGNNTDSDSAPLGTSIDLAITKTDGGVTAQPGDVIIYSLGYQNLGNQGVSGAVITETVPQNTQFSAANSTAGWVCAPGPAAGSTCSLLLGGLASGEQGTATFAVTLDDPIPESITSVFNSASITDDGSNGADINPSDNQAADTTPTTIQVDLGLVKELSNAPNPIEVGSVLEYTLTATNEGNSALTDVIVSDNLITPTGGTTPCARLEPQEQCTLIGTYVVTQADVNRGTVDNTGTATSNEVGPVTDQLSVPVVQVVDLNLVKQATLVDANNDGIGNVDETINYQLVATNNGNTTLAGVEITDPLIGALSCTPGQPAVLAPGATLTCSGSYVITFRDSQTGSVVNTATVVGEGPDSQVLTDTDQAVVPTGARPGVTVGIPVNQRFALILLVLLMSGAVLSQRQRYFK